MKLAYLFSLILLLVPLKASADDADVEIANNLDFFLSLKLIQTNEMLNAMKMDSNEIDSKKSVAKESSHEND